MKIEVCYLVDGNKFLDVIEAPEGISKEQAGMAAIAHAKSKGSRHFPFFKEVGN